MGEPDSNHTYIGKDLESMSYAQNYSKWIIELFLPYTGNNIAEVGAGTGNLTNLFSELDKVRSITAFEPSEEMHRVLSNNTSHSKKIITVNNTVSKASAIYPNRFDSIFYINVMEHIDNDQEEVYLIQSMLKDKGHVCIFVPALSWLYSDFDKSIGHYRRYHKTQLFNLFDKNGFDIIKIKYIDMFGIIPWYLNFVLLKRALDSKSTKIYDTYAIPLIKKLDKLIEPPLGKNLILVGQKK